MAGHLPFYIAEEDIPLLREHLNQDEEIAFIISDGADRWKAMRKVKDLHGKTMLWHVPGGPLPLLHPAGPDTLIEDPFAGWQELRPGRDHSVPYFGVGCPATLLLSVWAPGWGGLPADYLYISSLGWYGRTVGLSPQPTRRWWKRLRSWFSRHAVRVTRSGPLQGPYADIWALPAALRALEAGMERAEAPWLV